MIDDKIKSRKVVFIHHQRQECFGNLNKQNQKINAAEGFSAVILSAGFSSRMHDFKPLLPIGGIPAVGRLAGEFAAAGLDEIIVVVGHRRHEIEKYVQTLPALVRERLKIVFNPIFEEGMYTSVQAGVAAVSADKKAFFMLPVDYPLVSKAVFLRLMDFWNDGKQEATRLVYPVLGEKRGHPPLLSTEFVDEILTKEQPMGLRSFFLNHQHHAENIEVADETILWDMDRKEDYERLCEMFAQTAKK